MPSFRLSRFRATLVWPRLSSVCAILPVILVLTISSTLRMMRVSLDKDLHRTLDKECLVDCVSSVGPGFIGNRV